MTRPADATPRPLPFPGFGDAAFAFFGELASHQSREWFDAHQGQYETEIRDPLSRLVIALSLALAGQDVPLQGSPKGSIFRINRDIRFSRDKSPYKTNASAVLSRDGTKRAAGVLYFQIGPEASFAALGFYASEPKPLAALRAGLVTRPERWRAVRENLALRGLDLSRESEAARMPRGFDSRQLGDLADDLRLKSHIVRVPLSRADVASPALVDRLATFAAAGLPLLEFGWRSLAEAAQIDPASTM